MDEFGVFSGKGFDEFLGIVLFCVCVRMCVFIFSCVCVEVGGIEGKEGAKVLDNYEN